MTHKNDFGKDFKSILTNFLSYLDEEKAKMLSFLLPSIKEKDVKSNDHVASHGVPSVES